MAHPPHAALEKWVFDIEGLGQFRSHEEHKFYLNVKMAFIYISQVLRVEARNLSSWHHR